MWPCDVSATCEAETDAEGKQISGDLGADDAARQHVVINALHSLPGFRKMPEKN